MSRDEVIASICRLPSESNSRNVRILELLRQSGYSVSKDISEQEIEQYLRQHPDTTELWIRYSEDQRSLGWWIAEPLNPEVLKSDWFRNRIDAVRNSYLALHAEGKWTVGTFPITVKWAFDDKFKAFAFFVSQKIKELADLPE